VSTIRVECPEKEIFTERERNNALLDLKDLKEPEPRSLLFLYSPGGTLGTGRIVETSKV
jgi:hypothetical protein